MSKFCTTCGSNTEETTCNCNTISENDTFIENSVDATTENIPESATVTNQEPATETAPESNIPNISFDSEKASAAMNMAKDNAPGGFALAKSIFSDMIGNIHKDPKNEDTKLRLVIGGGHLLAVLLITFVAINLVMSMVLGSYASMITIPFSSKVCIALFLIVVTSLYILIPASVCYLASKKYLPEQTFINVLGVFCICTIPTTILYVLGGLGSLIDLNVGMFFVGVASIAFVIHCYEAVISVTKQNRNSALIILIGALCVTGLAQYFVIQIGSEALANQIQNAMMRSIGW